MYHFQTARKAGTKRNRLPIYKHDTPPVVSPYYSNSKHFCNNNDNNVMGAIQYAIDFGAAGYVDRSGALHGLDGKYATPDQLQTQLTEREQREVIREFRRTSAEWRTLRLMAEEIIELRKKLKEK